MSRTFGSNLKGKVRNFSLPKTQPLIPLYEAIVNSINAIDEIKRTENEYLGKIEIEVIRDNTLFAENDDNTIKGFRIKDNGIGFDENNMSSFMMADSDYKLGIGGKGVGRFSWLKAFSNVKIISTFLVEDKYLTRQFEFNLGNSEIEDVIVDSEMDSFCTIVELVDYLKDYAINVPKQLDTIAIRIIQHCFSYFLNDNCPEIIISDKDNALSLNSIFKEKFATDSNRIEFRINDFTFDLLNIKITDKSFQQKNKLHLCANDRVVDTKDLEKIIVDLDDSLFDREGYWYMGILTGKYLDDNVDMNRLSFNIPNEVGTLFVNEIGYNQILQEAKNAVSDYLKNYLEKVARDKKQRINLYTNSIAPQYRHLMMYVPDKIAELKPGLSDEQLDDALYTIKREFETQTKSECKNLIKGLDNGIISPEEYQDKFKNMVDKISDVNRAALAEYVVHRKVILELFKKGLNIKADGKFNLEKYMHQLIYPMRTTSEEVPYENHNLWLIDEKLSFCHFISSDMPFDNNRSESRTDILILDGPIAIAESKNDGTVYNSITIFELKKPMRDDYNMQENPITQLLNYAQKIKEGNVRDSNHRLIKVNESTQFYLYAVCDITPSLERVMDTMNYKRTPDGLGAYNYNNSLHAYTEILSYDKICIDTEKRNKVLFDKLGI